MNQVDAREIQERLEDEGPAGWSTIVARHGRTFRMPGGLVATADAGVVGELLHGREHTLVRSKLHRSMATGLPGLDGILFRDGDSWRSRISALMPALTHRSIDPVAGALAAHVEAACARADGADLAALARDVGNATFAQLALGADADDAFMHALEGWLDELERPRRRLDVARVGVRRLARLPLYRRALRARQAEARDALDRAMTRAPEGCWARRLRDDADLDLAALTEELSHVYWAYDAVHYLMTACLYELGRRPEWAERLRAESDEALGARARLERADLEAMPALVGFVHEVQRLYPATLGIARRTGGRVTTADGAVIEAGTEVLVLLHPLHHDPERWEEPGAFRPERWLDRPRQRRDTVTFAPFLHGPRKCIGRHLAMLELTVTTSHVARHFELSIDADVPQTSNMIPRFASPVGYTLLPRRS